MIVWKTKIRKVITKDDLGQDLHQPVPKVMPREDIKDINWVCPVCEGKGVIIRRKKEIQCNNCKI